MMPIAPFDPTMRIWLILVMAIGTLHDFLVTGQQEIHWPDAV